ncbi:MAG: hypothetical protein DHS20C18_46040 [Saprospiraceae bacterium]|nr:MAG: hypothetical protein DHS20C18_46040 [Saprospiraceae bacterium]
MNTLYLIGQLIIILLVFGLIKSLQFGLRHAFDQLQLKGQQLNYILAGVVLWLAILSCLAFLGFFQNFNSWPPRVFFALIPPVVLSVALLFSPFFRLLLKTIPASWLVYIQAFRILMELFLWLGYKAGYVPPQMTFEWLNFDIIVGITAPMAGFIFFGQGRFRKPEAILWNIFGMVLLINILIIATLSTPAPWRVFYNEPANTFVAAFPFIWIPGFIVPFALSMHIFSLYQVFNSKRDKIRFSLRR